MLSMIPHSAWLPMVLLFVGVSAAGRRYANSHKSREFILASGFEDYPDSPDTDAIERIRDLIPSDSQQQLGGDLTSSFPDGDGNGELDQSRRPTHEASEQRQQRVNMAAGVGTKNKRMTRFVMDPITKRFSELVAGFGSIPNLFLSRNRELFYNAHRMRFPTTTRKDFQNGGFPYSPLPSPGKKRPYPYYYTEPEGSEFLGGPGK